MIQRRLATLITILCTTMLLAAQGMAEEAEVPLVLDHMDVVAYDHLSPTEFAPEKAYGLVETIKQEGTVYLALDVFFQPPWTEEIDSVDVDKENIFLTSQDGTQIFQIGYFEYGQFELSTNWFSEYRPWDWKEEPKPFKYNAVFAVPRDIGPLDLHIGSFVAPIDGTVTIKEFPNPMESATLVITNARFMDSISRTESVGDLEVTTTIQDTMGKILSVEFDITPTMGNGDDPDHFFWHTDWVGIVCDNGYRGPAIGEEFMDSISENVSHNLSRSNDGSWSSGQAQFYFAVPADTTSFKLIYLGSVAAEGSVGP